MARLFCGEGRAGDNNNTSIQERVTDMKKTFLTLTGGEGNTLTSKLEGAIAKIGAGKTTPAITSSMPSSIRSPLLEIVGN